MTWFRCFSSLGCPDASLEDTLALARQFDVAAVELRSLAGELDLPAVWQKSGLAPAELAGTVRRLGGRVAMLDTSLKLIGHTDADRAKLLEFVPWAEALGCRHLRIFDGGKTLDDDELAQAADTFAWWREARGRQQWTVDLAVETHDALFTAAAIARMMSRTGAFSILWDAHHTWKRGREAPATTWAGTGAHVVHVHTKDSVATPGPRLPFTYVLPGAGEFPQTALRDALRAGGYRGALSLEWERRWHPELPPLELALAAANERNWW